MERGVGLHEFRELLCFPNDVDNGDLVKESVVQVRDFRGLVDEKECKRGGGYHGNGSDGREVREFAKRPYRAESDADHDPFVFLAGNGIVLVKVDEVIKVEGERGEEDEERKPKPCLGLAKGAAAGKPHEQVVDDRGGEA